jgi:hypothetical protein
MTGKNYEIIINPLGKILKVNGDVNWKNTNKELYMLNWQKTWIEFPENKVNPGDVWKNDSQMGIPGNPKEIQAEIMCKLNGYKNIDGIDYAVISQTCNVKGASAEFQTSYGLNNPYTNVKQGELSAMNFKTYDNNSEKTILFDYKNGRPIQSKQTGSIESDASLTDYQFTIIPTDVVIYQKQNYTNTLNYRWK